MPLRPEDLPSDPVHLTEMVLALDAEVATLRATVSTLKDMIFGARSERRAVIAAEQLPLNFSDIETLVAPPAPANDDREDKAFSSRNAGKAQSQHRRLAETSAAV
jgi:transposase